MPNFIPLTGFFAATWPKQYVANQLIGLRIATDRFTHRGIMPGDFAVVLKQQFAADKIRDGDLIVIASGEDCVEIAEYSSRSRPKSLLGKIVRSWRDY